MNADVLECGIFGEPLPWPEIIPQRRFGPCFSRITA